LLAARIRREQPPPTQESILVLNLARYEAEALW
jgi:hypothetical protein